MRRASKRIVSTVCYNNNNKLKKNKQRQHHFQHLIGWYFLKPSLAATAMKKLYNTAQKIKYNSLKLGSFDDIQLV